jgi:radical SAM superfamily enzyme YgiQ (UPF0313 family)
MAVESCTDSMLKSLGKSYTSADVIKAAEIFHRHQLPISFDLLLGAPGESYETLKSTFETLRGILCPVDYVTISVGIRVYKNTPLSELIIRERPDFPRTEFLQPVCYEPLSLSRDELFRTVDEMASQMLPTIRRFKKDMPMYHYLHDACYDLETGTIIKAMRKRFVKEYFSSSKARL